MKKSKKIFTLVIVFSLLFIPVKASAHKNGVPDVTRLPLIGAQNAITLSKHTLHAQELMYSIRNKYEPCYDLYRCTCGEQFKIYID